MSTERSRNSRSIDIVQLDGTNFSGRDLAAETGLDKKRSGDRRAAEMTTPRSLGGAF
jgi:hypothetical protein